VLAWDSLTVHFCRGRIIPNKSPPPPARTPSHELTALVDVVVVNAVEPKR